MNYRQRIEMISRLLVIGWCMPIQAHHSTSATYLQRERTEIYGVIVEFQFRNPHSFIHILVPDLEGKTERWAVEVAGTAELASDNVSATTLKPGDEVIVTGNPGRNPADHRLLLHSIKRPSDGWQWSPRWAR